MLSAIRYIPPCCRYSGESLKHAHLYTAANGNCCMELPLVVSAIPLFPQLCTNFEGFRALDDV